ncbi:hypothetical protein JRG66_05875 [Salinimicrobium tongyeongense]|uniref:HPt domain-containing protein n=1 Tax=Salinimicrobium tongyeongense TaxID=2809707 RepID=A0ABY6NV42_9FLAO|nr:hypothetical protein [Salinimicrobium tongyeongense]UZH56388.1 hypothetical protein JRG66_05875 [Salinimicrobium tongyeongense]
MLQLISDLLDLQLKSPSPTATSSSQAEKNYTLTEIRNFAGEDPEAMDAILTAFIESTRSNLLLLQTAFQKGQNKKVSAVAHKMLPMFRQLQVPHLVQKLAILENAGGTETESVDVPSLAKEVNELLANLQEEITG